MWLGHLFVGLILSVLFGFELKTIFLCILFSWLPNVDVILVKLGFFREEFHSGPTHSFTFSTLIGLLVSIFSLKYEFIAFLCYFLHLLFDLPTDKGVSLFYPFTSRKFTLNLWKETGFWGFRSAVGYYSQKWPKIFELMLIAIFILLFIFTRG